MLKRGPRTEHVAVGGGVYVAPRTIRSCGGARGATIHGTEEYFDADGSLIAGEYGRVSLWMGERVSHVEYAARRRRLFRDVRWRY